MADLTLPLSLFQADWIVSLVHTFVSLSSSPISSLEVLVNEQLVFYLKEYSSYTVPNKAAEEEEKENSAGGGGGGGGKELYGTLSASSFSSYYKACMIELAELLKGTEASIPGNALETLRHPQTLALTHIQLSCENFLFSARLSLGLHIFLISEFWFFRCRFSSQ